MNRAIRSSGVTENDFTVRSDETPGQAFFPVNRSEMHKKGNSMKFRKLTASLLSVALSGAAAVSTVLPAASMAVHAEETTPTATTDMTQYGTNLALNKTATASSQEADSVRASNAVDGNTSASSSRWGSNVGNGPDWIYVDLAKPSVVNAVRVFWESHKATSYKIQYATENPGAEASWTDVKVFNNRPAEITEVIAFDTPVNARYIRLYIGSHTPDDPILTSIPEWNSVSIYELEVYGEIDANYQDPQENVALNKTGTASSTETADFTAAKALDGDTSSRSSRWSSAEANGPHWIYVDLGKEMDVQTVRLYWETRKASNYTISTAAGEHTAEELAGEDVWTQQYSKTSHPADLKETISLDAPVKARYVRLKINTFTPEDPDGGVTWNTISIYEMEVYGGIPQAQKCNSVADIKDALELNPVTAESTKVTAKLPEFDADLFAVEYNGTDLEQVVDANQNILKPLVDKQVKVSYKITDKTTSAYDFKEITVTIPGEHQVDENDNAVPEILPPIQEWKGEESGSFAITENTKVQYADDKFAYAAKALADDYKEMTGKTLAVEKVAAIPSAAVNDTITFGAGTPELGEEDYRMTIGPESIQIGANHSTAAYWATRTILQGLNNSEDNTLAAGEMRDYPTMKVRGLIQDVGRKTFTLDYLKQLAKVLSWYKLNDFQVHLNDNYIQLEQYKNVNGEDRRLIDPYSAFRLESDIKKGGNDGKNQADLTAKDVFYTKEEFADYIEECKKMGITIVPEFDMPAHALAMTKVRPDLKTPDSDMPHVTTNGNRSPADHLDLNHQYDDVMQFVKSIWDEYTTGDDKVFDTPVIHIGADEYEAGSAAYRKYVNDMFKYAEDKGYTPRVWGSLTQLSQGDTVHGATYNEDGTVKSRRQINLWNFGWSNPKAMYDLGFDLINCSDGTFYIVPNAGYYYDYLGDSHLFNTDITRMGSTKVPAGDEQMVGGAFAIWNDMIDNAENGMSEYDIYKRTIRAAGMMGTNLWGKGSITQTEASAIIDQYPEVPGTNFNYNVNKSENGAITSVDMESTTDTTGPTNSLTAGNDVLKEAAGRKVLDLSSGKTATFDTLETAGLSNTLRVKVKRTSASKDEQILFESPYGTIKAVQKETGKVGFSRENHDYSFDYELPVGVWTELEFRNEFEKFSLYVDGEFVETVGRDGRGSLKATMMFPLHTVGSAEHPFQGYVDDIRVGTTPETEFVNTIALDRKIDLLGQVALAGNTDLIKEALGVSGKYAPTAEEVAAVTKKVEDAISKAEYERADYSRIDALLALEPEDPSVYKASSMDAFNRAKDNIVRDLPKASQADVDMMASNLASILLGMELQDLSKFELVSQDIMKATASSNQSGEEPAKAIDGDTSTMFHTDWDNTTMPHWLDIEFATSQTVDQILYTPRTGGGNGHPLTYDIQTSDDGKTYTTVYSGEMTNSGTVKTINLPEAVTTKHIRMVAKTARNNNFSCAEINFHKVVTGADTEGLNEIIAQAEGLKAASYPESSWSAMQTVLAKAKALPDTGTPKEVEAMKGELSQAICALAGTTVVYDYTMLQTVIDDITPAKLSDVKGAAALNTKLAAAKALVNNAESQEAIDTMTEELHAAWLAARYSVSTDKLADLK